MEYTLLDLIAENTTYTNDGVKRLLSEIEFHNYYNTVIVLSDSKGVYAFCRWNVLNENTADILDCIVRPDYRNKNVLSCIINKGLAIWPSLNTLVFERGYDDGKQEKRKHKISIDKLMRRLNNGHFQVR